jgi:hypothetical protein
MTDGFIPTTAATLTIALPGETIMSTKGEYYDEEGSGFPPFILFQRNLYKLLEVFYAGVYKYWIWFCLAAMFICLYRKPLVLWAPIVLIGLTRVFFPIIIGLSHWRPVVSGIIFLELCALAFLQSLGVFLFRAYKATRVARTQ